MPSKPSLPPLEWRALTIKQPWAELVAARLKTIETRSWYTNYRGPLAIHAGKAVDQAAKDRLWQYIREATNRSAVVLETGSIIATCTLADCRMMTATDEQAALRPCAPDRWAWVLRDVKRVNPPIPMPGKQGLWRIGHSYPPPRSAQ